MKLKSFIEVCKNLFTRCLLVIGVTFFPILVVTLLQLAPVSLSLIGILRIWWMLEWGRYYKLCILE